MREGSERLLVSEGLCPKNKCLLHLHHGFNSLLRCLFEINPVVLLVSHPISWFSWSWSILRVSSRCAAVSCRAIPVASHQLNNTLSCCHTASTVQLGISQVLPCCSSFGDFEKGSSREGADEDCSVVYSWVIFPDALFRSNGADSCNGCGAVGFAAPNAKIFLGASLIPFVFAAPQGI